MMSTDIKATRFTGTGDLNVGTRQRVRGMHVSSTGGGPHRLTLTNGVGGDVLLDMEFSNGPQNTEVNMPFNGILFNEGIACSTLTGIVSVTLFYG